MMQDTTSAAVLTVLTTLILFGAPATAGAQQTEWLQWGGPHGDFMTDVTGLADSWPEAGPPEIWSRPLGAGHTAILVAAPARRSGSTPTRPRTRTSVRARARTPRP